MNSYVLDCENEVRKGKGRIEIILGPMFSGKTTELIRRIRRFQLSRLKCVVVKYAKDRRYSDTDVITHDYNKISAISCLVLEDCKSEVMKCDVVGIDEAQFFPDLKDFCEDLANTGKVVVIAGLDGTFQRTAFGEILNLVPLAENVIKLSAICMICCNSASFTKRISKEKTIEIIGGTDKYMSVCRECYHFKESNDNNKRSPLKCITDNF